MNAVMILLWITLLYRTVGNTWQNSKGVLGLLGECVISLVLSCCNKILRVDQCYSLVTAQFKQWTSVWVGVKQLLLSCSAGFHFGNNFTVSYKVNIYKDNENVHSLYNAYTNIHNSFIHINPNWKEYKSSYQVSE